MKRRSISLSALVLTLGCGSVSGGDPALWSPSHDLGGGAVTSVGGGSEGGSGNITGNGGAPNGGNPGGGAPSGGFSNGGSPSGGAPSGGGGGVPTGGGGGGNSGTCQFHVDYTILTYHGNYSPKDIGAIWIEDANGAFVKSLNVWASTRIVHLVKWNQNSGGNKVDAVTSATAPAPGPRSGDWDCTDVNGNPVPDGNYKLMLEFTEEDSAFIIYPPGPSFSVDFQKGAPATITPPDQPYYIGITLTIQ